MQVCKLKISRKLNDQTTFGQLLSTSNFKLKDHFLAGKNSYDGMIFHLHFLILHNVIFKIITELIQSFIEAN